MVRQYTNTYSLPNTDIQQIASNKIGLLDEYLLMQTGENQYTLLVKGLAKKNAKVYTFTRANNYGLWQIAQSSNDFEYAVTNEYYVCSNVGYGRSLDLKINDSMTSFCITTICCLLCFAVFYKGVLFKCLRKSRRSSL